MGCSLSLLNGSKVWKLCNKKLTVIMSLSTSLLLKWSNRLKIRYYLVPAKTSRTGPKHSGNFVTHRQHYVPMLLVGCQIKKRGIEYEVNSLLHGKGLVNRGSIGEVKLLRALKLGGQEGVNSLENNVPRKV